LNSDGSYKLEKLENPLATYSILIKESDSKGYLLQGYDNGCLNKVSISSLLAKRIGRQYKNGLNNQANLIFLKIISKDEILVLHFDENNVNKVKAHKTINVSTRDHLHLQGYKVIYNDFKNLKYQILPISIHERIKRLVYRSFTSNGKSILNSNYNAEWKEIMKYGGIKNNASIQPNLFSKKVTLGSKVMLRYFKDDKEITIQITESVSSRDIYGTQQINCNTPLAMSILNKEKGDKVNIMKTENIVEILDILN